MDTISLNSFVYVFCTLFCPNEKIANGKFGSLFSRKASCNRVALPNPINYKLHVGSFHLPIIHRTLTWTTSTLMCVRDCSYACVYTWGLGTSTSSQHNIFDSENPSQFLIALLTQTGFKPRFFRSRVRRSTNWATWSPLFSVYRAMLLSCPH